MLGRDMDDTETGKVKDDSHRSDANSKSRKALHAWLSDDSSAASQLTQDLETYMSKAAWAAEADHDAGQWLFRTPQWTSFNKEDGRAVLWLQGPPGCGKSMLTAHIITLLQSHQSDSDANILYHYCHYDPQPTTSLEIVRSLLVQSLDSMTDDIVEALSTMQSKKPKLRPGDMIAEKLLWTTLQKLIAKKENRTYIVVDGLDESLPNASPLGRILSLLKGLGDESRTRFLLSSRFDCDIIEALREFESLEYVQVDMDEKTIHEDMLQYITYRVNSKSSLLRRQPLQIRNDIIQKVCQQAQSSFLYASLVLDELKGERIFSRATIAATLQALPSQLRHIYERLLEKPKANAIGKEVFQWVSCAMRSLSWDEVRSALAIVDGNVSEDNWTDLPCDVFVQESCGPLIEVFGTDRDQLRFVHPTVKDVLYEKDGPGEELEIQGAHSLISMKLLYFLQHEDLPSFSPELSFQENRELISRFSQRPGFGLYSYAVLNWFSHVAKCGTDLQEEVEEQLCAFLSSPACILWLKGALFMSRWRGQARDSTALTTDVVESLETWIQNRPSTQNQTSTVELGAIMFVRSWISHFLGLMQDWGRALELNPFWIHLIPKEFIDYESCFKQALTYRAEQAVIQLEERPFLTAKTHPTLWQRNCISIDHRRGLAYTWEPSSVQLSCYHMRTGLLAAQTKMDIGDRDLSSFELIKCVQCPQNRFLALLFRDKSELNQNNPVYDGLRMGLQPTSLVTNDGNLSWILQNELCFDELFAIPYTLGVGNVCSLTCLLELSHDGFMRTNLFGHPKWSFDSVLTTEEQLLRWELDEINLLAFSPDSSLLVTPSKVISMDTGKTLGTFSMGLVPSVSGVAIAADCRTFVIVRSGNTLEFIQVPGLSGDSVIYTHKFSGLIHILGISDGGRFTLLLNIRQHVSKSSDAPQTTDKFLQDCYIGVFDSRKKQWTPFMEIHPPHSWVHSSRDFSEYYTFCQFKAESRKIFESNKVVFQCPKGWTVSETVRCTKGLSPAQLLEDKCIVVIESEKLKDGFGTNPTLTHVGKMSNIGSSIPKILCADYVLGNWSPIDHSQEQLLLGDYQYDNGASHLGNLSLSQVDHTDNAKSRQLTTFTRGDRLIVSSDTLGQICKIKLQLTEVSDHQMSQRGGALRPDPDPSKFSYQISATHGTFEDDGHFGIHSANVVIHQSGLLPLQLQDVVMRDGLLAVGASVIDLNAFSSANGAIRSIELRDEIPALVESFETSCQPFATSGELTAPANDDVPHYTIFSNKQISFLNIRPTVDQLQLTNVSEQRDVMLSNVSTALGRKQRIVQFTKPIHKALLKKHQREAAENEVFIYIFDSDTGRMTWSVHSTSAGKIDQPYGRLPKAIWMFHPNQPLLFWTLPGHALHVSHIDSSSPPINVADSLIIENETFESIKFSPNGRYVALLARTAFVQIMLTDSTEEQKTQLLVVLDLHQGTSSALKVLRKPTLSFDIDKKYLKVYRLTSLGGVRIDRFSLPKLDHHDQQILTYIPDHCCCATCGSLLKDSCHISVREYLGLRRIVLCHSPIAAGFTTASGSACEPLILSIASPALPVDSANIGDPLVVKRRNTTFPSLISASGECIPEAFTRIHESTLAGDLASKTEEMRTDFEKRAQDKNYKHEHDESPDSPREIYQMQLRMSKSADTNDEISDIGSIEERWRSDYQQSVSDTKIPQDLTKYFSAEDQFAEWSAEYSDIFPATWAEFMELLALVDDDPDVKEWVEIFCRGAGIGCITPIYTHTFYYDKVNQDDKGNFDWTSAVDFGWIEEHAEWFVRRVWRNDFVDARMWYPFDHYRDMPSIRTRDENKKESEGSKILGSHGLLQLDLSDEGLNKEEVGAVRQMLGMRKFIDDMEHKMPGAGKMFRTRFHQFLNQSLIKQGPADYQKSKASSES